MGERSKVGRGCMQIKKWGEIRMGWTKKILPEEVTVERRPK